MSDNMMWALVKEKPEAGLWMKRVPIPEVGPNDVKIKIHKTAICGTDVHIYQWNEWAQHTIPVGLTAGHEYVGEVVEVGPGVQGFKIGDLVSGEGHITCGKCRNCLEGHKENCKDAKGVGVNRNGAFAEYLVIPSSNVWPCNPNIPEEMYAIFDPFGNATHTALSYDMLGEDVLITGAGPIGINREVFRRKTCCCDRSQPVSSGSCDKARCDKNSELKRRETDRCDERDRNDRRI